MPSRPNPWTPCRLAMPDTTEVTISGTISILSARMNKSPMNSLPASTASTKPPNCESIPAPCAKLRKTHAVKVAKTRAARICQCAAMRFIPASQGDHAGEIQNHPHRLKSVRKSADFPVDTPKPAP